MSTDKTLKIDYSEEDSISKFTPRPLILSSHQAGWQNIHLGHYQLPAGEIPEITSIQHTAIRKPDPLVWQIVSALKSVLETDPNNSKRIVGDRIESQLAALKPGTPAQPSLTSNDLCWYQHIGWQDGSTSWAKNNCIKVGSGWSFKTVFASSDGVIYGINANNELLWYKHNGWQNGSPSWASGTGTKVGSGWNFKTVFASSNGVIYGINANNELCWYRHNGWENGSPSWASNNCTKVGSGWDFTTVFASSNGVIYGLKPNGDLYWYRHDGWQDGSNRWANGGTGIKVGSGWNFRSIFATSDGSVYGIVK